MEGLLDNSITKDDQINLGITIKMISLTELAAKHIKDSLSARKQSKGIKLGVKLSGCSGLSYTMEFVDTIDSWDDEITSLGVRIFVAPKDIIYLNGLTVDWKREGLNEGFEFINPNEKARCGCGESFIV